GTRPPTDTRWCERVPSLPGSVRVARHGTDRRAGSDTRHLSRSRATLPRRRRTRACNQERGGEPGGVGRRELHHARHRAPQRGGAGRLRRSAQTAGGRRASLRRGGAAARGQAPVPPPQASARRARAPRFADAGAMWRAGYDMPPDSFVAVVDKLCLDVRPLYLQLHAYVRRRLVARYGTRLVLPTGMLPVQLTGNMWGQDWSNIADIAIPAAAGSASAVRGVDLTAILKARHVTPHDMVRMGERFYASLGFDSLPATFWERSLFVRPTDRDVGW